MMGRQGRRPPVRHRSADKKTPFPGGNEGRAKVPSYKREEYDHGEGLEAP